MRRQFLCGLALALAGPVLGAQPIPARDLWQFPLGAVLEPAALATEDGTGLWNPSSIVLREGTRARVGVAQLSLSNSQGVSGTLAGVSWRRPSGITLGFSVARSAVDGIVRTDTDPTDVGGVNYSSTLYSVTAARVVLPHLSAGVAARYRDGRADVTVGSAIAADLGVTLDSLPWHDARIALSSFLWRPGREHDDQPVFLSAADARLFSRPSWPEIRAGYALNSMAGGLREHGPFGSVQAGVLEVRAALSTTVAYGHQTMRARTGIALHYPRYVVGIGREEGVGGLGPLYQITLTGIIK